MVLPVKCGRHQMFIFLLGQVDMRSHDTSLAAFVGHEGEDEGACQEPWDPQPRSHRHVIIKTSYSAKFLEIDC